MATKYSEYKNGEEGYNAMVADVTSAFSWDDIVGGNDSTVFKKFNGSEDYIALTIYPGNNTTSPSFSISRSKDGVVLASGRSPTVKYAGYAYGDNFLALCSSTILFPVGYATYDNTEYAVITSCTNLVTGDTGYCVAMMPYGSTPTWYSKHSVSSWSVPYSIKTNATVGIAHPFHDEISGDVAASNILLLRATPDEIKACLTPVNFNGRPYTRLGRLLVATS